jgi:hypothetical protein
MRVFVYAYDKYACNTCTPKKNMHILLDDVLIVQIASNGKNCVERADGRLSIAAVMCDWRFQR